jgi:diguanylate cyclase (GGDEF)-like protein
MAGERGQKRVLLAAPSEEVTQLRELFAQGKVPGWEASEAETWERARFLVQMDPPDVFLLDASLCPEGDTSGLAWLTSEENLPIVLLAPVDPSFILNAFSHGAHQWLPRDLAISYPVLLAVSLHQAARLSELQDRARTSTDALTDCQKRVKRLVNLLWETSPVEGHGPWFTQRHMLERLEEEIARVQRHGGPLTIVLGEVQPRSKEAFLPEQAHELAGWTAQVIGKNKRRCDVAGHYGLTGFLMVLPRVSEEEAASCCRRLKNLLEHPAQEHPSAPLHVHFGIATCSPTLATVQGLLGYAEDKLEQARNADRSPEQPEP